MLLLCGIRKEIVRIPTKDLLKCTLLGALGLPLTYGVFYSGMAGSSATEANLVIAAEPIIVAVLAWFLLKERLSNLQQVGLIVGFVGLYILIMQGLRPVFQGESLANAIMTFGLLIECMGSILGKSLANKYPGLLVVSLEFISGSILTLPFAIREWELHPLHAAPQSAWFAIAYLCIGCSFVAYGVWYLFLPKFEVSAMSGFLFVQPLAGPFMAWYFRGEAPHSITYFGAALVLAGVWLVTGAVSKSR